MPQLQHTPDGRQSRGGGRTPVRDRSEKSRRHANTYQGCRAIDARLEGSSRHPEFLGGLPLGNALISQRPILFKEVCACESIPAWLGTMVDLGHILEEGSHSDLLCQSLAC